MNQITPEDVRAQLAEIIVSKDFIASDRLRHFLTYIVEETLKGRGAQLKAFNIALDVFNLGEDFDAVGNPLIRNEAARLRSKLEHYYLLNPAASIYISIPKGSYRTEFSRVKGLPGRGAENVAILGGGPGAAPSACSQHKAVLAVEPVVNINKSKDGELFGAALFNDLSLDLTREDGLLVVSRLEPDPVGKARFILKSSVVQDKKRLVVWVFLMDTRTGFNVWADKFETSFALGREKDILNFEEHVAGCVIGRVCGDSGPIQQVLLGEYSSGQSEFSPVQAATVLYSKWAATFAVENAREALMALEAAIEADPRHMPIRAMYADIHICSYQFSYGLMDEPLEKAMFLASEAVAGGAEYQLCHLVMAGVHAMRSDRDKFMGAARRVMGTGPLFSSTVAALAPYYAVLGMTDEALELGKKILALNLPHCGECHVALALCHYLRGEYAEALAQARKIEMPGSLWDGLLRLCASGMLREDAEAVAAAADLLKAYPLFVERGEDILKCAFPSQIYLPLIREGLAAGGIWLN